MKNLANISNAVSTGLINKVVITDSLSIPAFAIGWSLPVGVHEHITALGEYRFSKIKPIICCKPRKILFN